MSEGNVPGREDTETTQQHCPQQDCRLVIGALLLGFGLALHQKSGHPDDNRKEEYRARRAP